MGAQVLKVAHVHRIHLYDVPILGSERSRQKCEAQNTADASCDHQRAKGYLHPVHVRVEFARNSIAFNSCVTRIPLVLFQSKRWRDHYGMRGKNKTILGCWCFLWRQRLNLQYLQDQPILDWMNQAHERDNSLTETAAASAWEGLGVAREAHKFTHDKILKFGESAPLKLNQRWQNMDTYIFYKF